MCGSIPACWTACPSPDPAPPTGKDAAPMTPSPAAADYASFAEGFVAGQGQVLWRERVADLETPVGAFLKLAAGRPNSFLLESVEGGSARGRYSAIGLDPDLIWRCRGGQAEVNRHAL